MKSPIAVAILVTLVASNCQVRESIPARAAEPRKDARLIQKSVTHGGATVFLQARRRGIKTNDLILEAKDGSLRYLALNPFFITDFCISDEGMVYFCEAGMDHGYEVGTRGHDFRLKRTNLKDGSATAQPLLPDKSFSEPNRLELSHDQRLLCFATRFGDIHIIDVAMKREIDLDLNGIDPAKVCGHQLSADGKSFIASVNTGTAAGGAFLWERRGFPLPTSMP